MPRRTRRIKPRQSLRPWQLEVQAAKEMTPQEMARDLVERGLASPVILGPVGDR